MMFLQVPNRHQLTTIVHIILFFIIFQWKPVIARRELKKYLSSLDQSYPLINRSQSVTIEVGIELIQILEINERSQHIVSKMWMRMYWTNDFTKWKPSDWENTKVLKVKPQEVWTPDIFLYDDVSNDISSSPLRYNTQVILYSNGTNRWLIPIVFESSCRIHVENFPFDKQSCKLKFGSWSSSKEEIDIIAIELPLVTQNYVNSSEWILLGVDKSIHSVSYDCCPNPYIDITFTIHVQRKPLYYYFNILCPCFILMAVTLFSFFLPPESGERISVVITVLLSFAVFLQLLGDNLPRNSHSTPMLSVFYIAVMAESACSLICTCFVLSVYYRGLEKCAPPLPLWVKNIFPQVRVEDCSLIRQIQKNSREDIYDMPKHGSSTRRRLSRLLSDENYEKCANGFSQLDVGPDIDLLNDPMMKRRRTVLSVSSTTDSTIQPLEKISRDLGIINACVMEQTICDEIQQEWQRLAKILDRLFLFLFLFIYLITGFIILLPGYMVHISEERDRSQ